MSRRNSTGSWAYDKSSPGGRRTFVGLIGLSFLLDLFLQSHAIRTSYQSPVRRRKTVMFFTKLSVSSVIWEETLVCSNHCHHHHYQQLHYSIKKTVMILHDVINQMHKYKSFNKKSTKWCNLINFCTFLAKKTYFGFLYCKTDRTAPFCNSVIEDHHTCKIQS